MNVLDAIRSRSAIRAYLDRPVPGELVETILDSARWAPSGVNSQPWQVAVVQGETRERIAAEIIEARAAGAKENADYQYYPREWIEPYKARRKDCGLALYGALEIRREDKARQVEAWNNNYRFFGAPTGLLFFIDRRMEQGSWVDMGMFIQNVMLAAREFDLATCPQASLADFPDIIRRILGIDEQLALVCGMALGYPDPDAPVNQYRLERAPIADFCRWYD